MPTIEIVSIDSDGLNLNQEDFDVAIIEEHTLESHRALFDKFLSSQKGVIVHIGNPAFKEDKDGGFFAGQIVDWSFQPKTHFQFKKGNTDDLKKLLKLAMDKSPASKAYFLTDYQFGPETKEFKTLKDLKAFWSEHDNNGLRLNTLYEIDSL